MTRVLGTYSASDLQARFADVGLLRAVEDKGFSDLEVSIESQGQALPHTYLRGRKDGQRYILLEACLAETTVRPPFFQERGFPMEHPVHLAVAYWVREQDPTRPFPADRPPLPLQQHPGLGVIRHAFHVIVELARELGKDGVSCVPKFYHDAYIFYRSRLFLFLDGNEQGRFEAITRDLHALSLRDTSIAFLGNAVHDQYQQPIPWQPGYQVYPLSDALSAYFNSPEYAERVQIGCTTNQFHADPATTHLTAERLHMPLSS